MFSTDSSLQRSDTARNVRGLLALVAQLAAALALPAAALAQPQPADPTPEFHTVLYMVPRTPVIIRLNVEVDGRTLNEAWRAYIDDWFHQLDRNGDGVLRGEEAARIPSVRELAALKLVSPKNAAVGGLVQPRGDQTLADFTSFLNLVCGNALSVNIVPKPPAAQPENRQSDVGQALFQRLDVDRSGHLSADEIQWTAALSKLDRDDDDTLSRAELEPVQLPFFVPRSDPAKSAKAGQSMLYVNSSDVRVATARQILDRYDGANGGPRDQQLDGAELGLSAEALGRADNDGNGALDLDELREWLRAPTPDVEITCRLGSQNGSVPSAQWRAASARPRSELALQITDRALIVDRVYLVLEQPQVATGELLRSGEARFKQLDEDGNGYLDQKEVPPLSEFAADFSWMDADHDGKVFLKEFLGFLERRRAALRARVELTIAEQANQLFELFDANGDGRLTARELVVARGSFAKWDFNGDGRLLLGEIPHRWQWLFTRGMVANPDMLRIAGPNGRALEAAARSPAWFRQMDRNQDGEVAHREFLGPLSTFDRLDTNHNRVLDSDEAALAR